MQNQQMNQHLKTFWGPVSDDLARPAGRSVTASVTEQFRFGHRTETEAFGSASSVTDGIINNSTLILNSELTLGDRVVH